MFIDKIKTLLLFRQPEENIIFLHLPKAGGTTLRQIFYKQYRYLKSNEIFTVNRTKETHQFLELADDEKNKIKLLIGHFPFGLHRKIKKKFSYVTFMRDPVERVVSAFYYNKEKETSDVYNIINDSNLTFMEYLKLNVEPWSMNAMTKHLAGCDAEGFKKDCTIEMFDMAINNLKKHFICIGLTEHFDESLLILKEKLNWRNPYYKRQNVTKIKQEVKDIDKGTIAYIKELNKFDIMIYDFGKQFFLNDWNAIENEQKKLDNFRHKNG